MSKYLTVIIGILSGILYYYNMKLSIKKPYKNCSFVSNKTIDLLAFLIGIILIYYGLLKYNNEILIIIGIAIITEHLLQFSYKL